MNFEIAPKETEIQATWDDAKLYCFALNIDGTTGWRLPTKDELNEIYESVNDFEKAWYWSSTEGIGGTACLQDMSGGYKGGNLKDNGGYWVRAVRDLKDN
jgi:hypothetical protein